MRLSSALDRLVECDRVVSRHESVRHGPVCRAGRPARRDLHTQHVRGAEQTLVLRAARERRAAKVTPARLAAQPVRPSASHAHQGHLAQGGAHHHVLGQAGRQDQV